MPLGMRFTSATCVKQILRALHAVHTRPYEIHIAKLATEFVQIGVQAA